LTRGDEDAWRELVLRAAEPNPFFEPDIVLPAFSHLDARGTALLVNATAKGWTGCLPVQAARLGGVLRALRSWCHLYVFLGTPLVDRDQPVAAFTNLVAAAAHERRFVALELLGADGALRPALERDFLAAHGLTVVVASSHERATLERRARGAEHRGLRGHHERDLGRLRRRLEEALGTSVEARDRSDDPSAIEMFLALEGSGWKGRAGTAMACNPAHAAFFRELCARFRSSGRLQLLALEAGGRPIAMKCNLAAGDLLFCFKIAYDDALRRYSPGIQLERSNIEIFRRQRGERSMDSCATPDNQMINRLWPDRRRITSLIAAPAGARTTFSVPGIRSARAVRRYLRRS
jgi:CelD/BcsL family acetyltransferase involved in cellulose biosynthesis